jgi:hypothetical protein
VNGRKPRGDERCASPGTTPVAALVVLAMALGAAACSTTTSRPAAMPAVSIQTVQFYPYLVKGFENSYPKRTIVVITPALLRDFAQAGNTDHTPYQGHPAIGVILDQRDQVVQRLYGPSLGPLLRDAIAEAAREAGMAASTSTNPLQTELQARRADYVLAAALTELWVVKQRGKDTQAGPRWFSAARVAMNVAIYKPPFDVPFWQGVSSAQYDDPAMPAAGAMPEDETEIYSQPGQVLSVALSRAVAGIFQHDDLHTLLLQDAPQNRP